MRWEDTLLALFDDLEQQADGLALAERDADVAELGRAEYASVDLAARLHATIDVVVSLRVSGVGPLEVRVLRVGSGWLLGDSGGADWLVCADAVETVTGLPDRAVAESARPVTGRLRLSSALRGLAEAEVDVVVRLRDGVSYAGRVGRVGADFVEVRDHDLPSRVTVVAFGALAAVRAG